MADGFYSLIPLSRAVEAGDRSAYELIEAKLRTRFAPDLDSGDLTINLVWGDQSYSRYLELVFEDDFALSITYAAGAEATEEATSALSNIDDTSGFEKLKTCAALVAITSGEIDMDRFNEFVLTGESLSSLFEDAPMFDGNDLEAGEM